MNKNKALEFWAGLPTWSKGVLAVGGVAIGYFTVRSFIKKIKKDADLAKQRETTKAFEKDVANLSKSGVNPTFSLAQYKQWADSISEQFSGCDFTATYYSLSLPFASSSFINVATIIKQFKNNADFASLVIAFDQRNYDQCGVWNGDFSGNLTKAVIDELKQPEIEELNNILISKGITYKF